MSALTCDPPTPEFTFVVALAVLFVRFGSIIERVLIATQWNCKMAVMQLKISDKALLYKMKQHRIFPPGISGSGLRSVHV